MGSYTVSSGSNLHDGTWHEVSIISKPNIKLTVDSTSDVMPSKKEPFKEPELNTFMYVGSFRGERNYTGCMKNVKFKDLNLLKEAYGDDAKGFIKIGNLEFECKDKDYSPVSFLSPQSFVEVTHRLSKKDTFNVTFKFRTFKEDGLLLSQSSDKVMLYLQLQSGSLSCTLTPNGTNVNTKTSLSLGSNLQDGEWHSVSITRLSEELQVSLDGMESKSVKLTSMQMSRVFVGAGGPESKYSSFMGCMANLEVGSLPVELGPKKEKCFHKNLRDKCNIQNLCLRDPCQNGGICSHDGKNFNCSCSIDYEGRRCEKSVYEPTCGGYRALGLKSDAKCLLDSEASTKPYWALCIVNKTGRTYTILSPNRNVKKIQVEDCDNSVDTIDYDAQPKQITALIEKSQACQQRLQFNSSCVKATLFTNTHAHGQRRGKLHPIRSDQTNCIPNKTCIRCDLNVTDKAQLPIRKLQFQSMSGSFYTLGPLECWTMESGVMNTEVKKLAKKLGWICRPDLPTDATTERTTAKTACIHPAGPMNHDCVNQTSPTTATLHSLSSNPRATDGKDSKVSREQMNQSPGDGPSTIVLTLICSCIVVVLLLATKIGLPRVIVYIRTHSKKGEYILPLDGTYPARMISRERFIHSHYVDKHLEGNAADMKSYWV